MSPGPHAGPGPRILKVEGCGPHRAIRVSLHRIARTNTPDAPESALFPMSTLWRNNIMDDYLKQAIELVKAQSSVRVMQEEEMVAMIRTLASSLKDLESGVHAEEEEEAPMPSPAKSIREKSITCLECGKSFKLITRKHLAKHGLDADSYRRKWGIKSDAPLVCKSIQRVRRKKMKDMRLWEKRHASED